MKSITFIAAATLLVAGCNITTREGKDGNKNVEITSNLGNLKVDTEKVDAKDTGLSVYPGSRLKEREHRGDDNRANVNIDTPWFGVKVVAVTYLSDDSPEQVWDYYKKEMTSRYGAPLECRPGSADLKREKQDKDDLTCDDKDNRRNRKMQISIDDMELKVGTDDRQRIVAVKPVGKGTQYSLVYVSTREERETI